MRYIWKSILACLLSFVLLFQCCVVTPTQAETKPKTDFPEIGKYVLRYMVCYKDNYCHTNHLNTYFWRLSECNRYADEDLTNAINAYSERRGGIKSGWVQCGLVQEEGIPV